MKQYRIRISSLAEQDLEDLADYIAYDLHNLSAALGMVKGIKAKINDLVNYPLRNELDEDEILASLGIRAEYYKNYKIFYICNENEQLIGIVRILHVRMDSKKWLYHTFGLR